MELGTNVTNIDRMCWTYEPVYLPAPRVIHMGENSAVIAEPLLFSLAFGQRPDTGGARYPMTHAIGFQAITAVPS